MTSTKRRRNDVNYREMNNNTIVDGVSGDAYENYLRANVVGKSTKVTVKLNNTCHLHPIPGKFPVKTCINPKLTILKLILLMPWNLILKINRQQFWII